MTISSSSSGGGGGRVEVNLLRLLSRCEAMAADRTSSNGQDWRLGKYIEKLNEYMAYLRKLAANAPSPESMTDYTRRVELLRGIVEAEKLATASDKALAVEMLVSSKQSAGSGAGSRELHQHTKARHQKDAREELFGSSDRDGRLTRRSTSVLHQSGAASSSPSRNDDVDVLLKHHREEQEKLAENMVYLARSLKENARAAGRIVRDDKEKLVESSRLAETNFGKLKVESGRLEHHANKSCSWWIFIMLIVVVAVFVWMVIFMKMFSKK